MFNMNQTIDQQPSNRMSSYHHVTPTIYHHHPTHYQDYYHHTATQLDTLLEPNGPQPNNPSPIVQQTSMTSHHRMTTQQNPYTSTLQQSLTQQQYQNYYDTQQLNSNDNSMLNYGTMRYTNLSPATSDKNSGSGCMLSDGISSPSTLCDWSGYTTVTSPSSSSNLSSSGSIKNVNNNSSYHVPNLYCNQQIVSPVSNSSAPPPQQQQHHQQQEQQQQQVHHHNISPQTASSSSREQRNRAEKMRRDKINQLINELGKLVPLVLNSPKRVHKTSVLRLTSTWLRIQLLKISYKKKLTDNQKQQPTETTATANNTDQQNSNIVVSSPSSQQHQQDDSTELGIMENSFLVNSMVQMVCEQLGGFLMVLSTSGKIVLVSHNVEKLLERDAFDLMGQSIYDITHKEDHHRLRHQLNHSFNQMEDTNGGEMRRNFNLRIARSKPRATEPISFVPVSISGVLIPDECLMCIVRVWKPTPLNEQLVEAGKDEYITRHLVDGRIITCDQRISVVAGYMTEEVAGLSAFNFMHKEDVRWTMIALRQMYDRGESRGSSCYRLMTRTGDFIYLRTCGYLEVDSNGVVESFVCVNTLVTAVEGEQLIREMKERYSALIKPSNPLSLTECGSTATVEDPQKLKEAIQYLMHELPKVPGSPETKDCNNSDSSPPTPKRSRTESPIISSSMPLPETTIISHLQYTNSVHQQATISLDRQLRKQATTNHYPNNNNNNKQYSRSNDKLMNKYNLSKK